MQIAPIPDNEAARLAMLRSYAILDTPAEVEFDDFTRLASLICGMPVTLISLVDEHRQWFKSKVGLDASETPRELAFCAHAILSEEIFEVPDAFEDARFSDNPIVTGAPHVRYYAGAPLITPNGLALGTLCVIDHTPRRLTDEQRNALTMLARQVVRQLELHLTTRQMADGKMLLHNVVNAIPNLIFFKDKDGNYLGCNQAFEQYFGAKESQIIGKTDFDFIDHDTATFFREMDKRMLISGKAQVNEDIIQYPDGKKATIEMHKMPYFYGDEFPGVIGVGHDITMRKQQMQALREIEERFSFAVQGAGDGIWDWNVLTGEMPLSGNYEPMLGFDKGELEPTIDAWIQSVHPDDLARVQQNLQDYMAGKLSTYVVELRLRCKDGGYAWVLCRGAVVARNKQGKPVRMVGIQSNISERKVTEQALLQAREYAERANQAKSQFLTSMSHELRTPMNAILGFAQILEYDDKLDIDQQDSVHEILKGGQHLLNLINEVLDLAKIESGQFELSLEPLEISPLVDECFILVGNLADKRNIKLTHSNLTDVALRADRVRFKQVLLNLLSNAVKYNREGGSVHFDIHAQGSGQLRMTVTDTGLGIPQERLSEVFQPFNRLEAESSGIEGTGIGLSITLRLMEAMGGAVGVNSELGVGSTFWIDLPIETLVADAALVEDANEVTPQSVTESDFDCILYIDDNPVNLKLVAQMLSRRKHIKLLTTHLPVLGVELALAHLPALILLDINMPGMDGYQVMEVLKADLRLQHIPVIAVTANAMLHDIERGKAAGFTDYIPKPLNLNQFLKAIDHVLTDRKGNSA